MFKYGYKYRIKSYEELKQEGVRKINEDGTLFKDTPIGYLKEMNTFGNQLLNIRCSQGEKYVSIGNRTIETWMCEELGKIIEPLKKFEIGKEYRVLNWNELMRVRDSRIEKRDNLKVIKSLMDNNIIFEEGMLQSVTRNNFTVTPYSIDKEKGFIIHNGWQVSPWMCKEVENYAELEERKSYRIDEVIKELIENKNMVFLHPISKCELYLKDGVIQSNKPEYVLFVEGWEKSIHVNFQEAINKGEKLRVESELINKRYIKSLLYSTDHKTTLYTCIKDFLENKYLPLNKIMYALAYMYSEGDLTKIIEEGKWYYM